jgi:hypothetical protein
MKYVISIIAIFIVTLIGCHQEDIGPGFKEYHDDFERYNDSADLVDSLAGDRWTEYNVNDVNRSTNPISIDSVIVHSGNRSVRFEAVQPAGTFQDVVKCNLNKNGFYFPHGETVMFSAWFYIEDSTMDYGTFFILDLGDIVGGSQEIRIMCWEENVEVERNKIGLPNIFQEEPVKLIPINQWCHVELEVGLSQYRNGFTKMWIDGEEVLYKNNIITLPKDRGTLVWGTKGYYERIQVGITAQSYSPGLVMYVDDVDITCK